MATTIVVPVGDVARHLGLRQPLPEETAWTLEQAIIAAQSDVEAYLGRSLLPEQHTDTGLIPWPDGWHLTYLPLLEILSVTAETFPDTGSTTGLFTVAYRAGIDAAADPGLEPIRRFVRVHAMYSPEVRAITAQQNPDATRRVSSLTAEGQSVSYDDVYPMSQAMPGTGNPGALPTLKSLDRWRVAKRRVYQKPVEPGAAEPWPYEYRPGMWRWW